MALTGLSGGYISFRRTTIARKGSSSRLDAPVFIPDAISRSTVGHTYSGTADFLLAMLPYFDEKRLEASMGKEAYDKGENYFRLS